MSGTLLVDLHASLLRACTQLASRIEALTQKPTGAIYFDAYADEDTLPSGDQVGLSGLTFELADSHIVEGSFMFVYSTQTDANLFRLMQGVNLILSLSIPGMAWDVVDSVTGSRKGSFWVVDGTRAMPVAGKVARPLQAVAVNFTTTVDYRPEG